MTQYAESKYSGEYSITAGALYDYAHFNYKILTIKKEQNLQLSDLFVFSKLNKKAQEFIIKFNNSINEYQYVYGNNAIDGLCWGDSQFAYTKDPDTKKDYVCRLFVRGDDIVIRIYLSNIDTYSDYIKKLPAYIKESFINDSGKCRECKEGKCRARKSYTIDNKEYAKCNGETFYFKALELETIPYYIDLINLSTSRGKCKTVV